jgi:hypothetical protein
MIMAVPLFELSGRLGLPETAIIVPPPQPRRGPGNAADRLQGHPEPTGPTAPRRTGAHLRSGVVGPAGPTACGEPFSS